MKTCCLAFFVGLFILVPFLSASELNPYILQAVHAMPAGGGYASDRAAEVRLARRGVVWRPERRVLEISPQGASPSFCSAACYMVMLRALQDWEQRQKRVVFPPELWHALRVLETHPDGALSWGRFNANGPGCAKWVHDLHAGYSFTSPEYARPGDFLKIFFSSQAGVNERGHLVIFLGIRQVDGQRYLTYWSANKRTNGFGIDKVALNDKRVCYTLFTRIINPERIADAVKLPPNDLWLAEMLTRVCRFAEMEKKCSIEKRPPS